MASSWRSSRWLRSGIKADLNEVVTGGNDDGVFPEARQQPLESAGARLDRLHAAGRTEVGESDAGEGLGRVREDAEPRARRAECAERGARVGIGPQQARRPVLRRALPRRPHVSDTPRHPEARVRGCRTWLLEWRTARTRNHGVSAER